ncbi:hypothetical protein GOODEAATRI_015267 [Goodea atripinnis]|uniref:Uncharacterized protein n=1 Tax=Goodea atripinnis TaxID=208336 RepID=A0ABV0NUQ2_9TELE
MMVFSYFLNPISRYKLHFGPAGRSWHHVFQPADVRGRWSGQVWPFTWLSHGEREQHNRDIGKGKIATCSTTVLLYISRTILSTED